MEPTVEPTAEPSMEPTAEPSTLAPSAGAAAAAKATLPPGSIAAAVILSVFGFCCISYLCYFWIIPTCGIDTGGARVGEKEAHIYPISHTIPPLIYPLHRFLSILFHQVILP